MKKNYLLIPVAVILGVWPLSAYAQTEVSPLHAAVEAARKAPKNQALNRAAGDALKAERRFAEAIPFYMKGGNAGNLGAAEASFYLYDFDKASEYLDKYMAKRTKTEAERDKNFSYSLGDELMDWSDYLGSRIDMGRSMLDRVEKIQVIDSVNVPADNFIEFIRASRSSGSLQGEGVISRVVSDGVVKELNLSDVSAPGYLTENGEEMIWAGVDNDGRAAMFESFRLSDGSWEKPSRLFDYNSIFGSNNGSEVGFPFLLADGVTLYFAADGEESLGGLDIFISRRDENGFLQPSNVGMPYNSPYNDYMLAIDEQNGVGWWVTDRACIPDTVTVYTFLTSELRDNYSADTPMLTSLARMESIADTQKPGVDYSDVKRRIEQNAEARRNTRSVDFDFAMPDGRVLHRLSDFRSSMARSAMKDYLREQEAYKAAEKALEALRQRYAGGDRSVSNDILRQEKELEKQRKDLLQMSNQVVTAETL